MNEEIQVQQRSSETERIFQFRRNRKNTYVSWFGSKCGICGYNKSPRALEFHHLDPKVKEMVIGSGNNKSIAKTIEELKKCICVCANCHREIHDGTTLVPEDIQRYAGPMTAPSYAKVRLNCSVCGKICNHPHSKTCSRECSSKTRKKVQYPEIASLLDMIQENGYEKTGRLLGVSGNAVRKHLKTRSNSLVGKTQSS